MTGKRVAKPPKVEPSRASYGCVVGINGPAGPAGPAASPVPTESPAQIGRPPGSTEIDYTDMDALIDYKLLQPSAFTQATLIELIQHLYAKKSEKTPPGVTTIKDRIAYLKSQQK
jgi:hypothetical protein